jgi:hypothetical protein
VVDGTREVGLSRGAKAGAGDIIIGRRNDHGVKAGAEDRTLANGDVMRVESVAGDGTLMVRRRTERDPATGAWAWSAGVPVPRLRECRAGLCRHLQVMPSAPCL